MGQEENKVLRAQLEMSQVRQEIDRRIQEKEEYFEHSRKALLDAAIRGQRQVEQELIDTREQVSDMNGSNTSLNNAKRKLENDIHQMQADLDNMLASCKNSEEKAKKAMVDAGRLADELRAEQDHAAAQEKAARTTEVSLAEMQNKAEQASFAMARGASQIPAKLEDRAHNIEMELNRAIQHTDEVHKTITKGERRVKELLFQQEENKKNQDRITDLVDKLQQKIKSYKKQIEEAEEIAAINLAKFRKASSTKLCRPCDDCRKQCQLPVQYLLLLF